MLEFFAYVALIFWGASVVYLVLGSELREKDRYIEYQREIIKVQDERIENCIEIIEALDVSYGGTD
jgi:hypothetical protein